MIVTDALLLGRNPLPPGHLYPPPSNIRLRNDAYQMSVVQVHHQHQSIKNPKEVDQNYEQKLWMGPSHQNKNEKGTEMMRMSVWSGGHMSAVIGACLSGFRVSLISLFLTNGLIDLVLFYFQLRIVPLVLVQLPQHRTLGLVHHCLLMNSRPNRRVDNRLTNKPPHVFVIGIPVMRFLRVGIRIQSGKWRNEADGKLCYWKLVGWVWR